MRKSAIGLLPDEIINKRKQGFSPPEGSWYKGKLMKYIMETLKDKKTVSRGYFNNKYIDMILNEHMSGKHNHRLLIWSLLSFEWWCRLFLDKES